ncbi:MAG: SDR family oxidoreductase [Thermoplasmata archaeon]|nr:SDR family oxidoreductase [Thermoplasmata archaeon]
MTGASGYVGGRLVPALLEAGAEVRCLVRTPEKLAKVPWRAGVEVVPGSVGDDLGTALSGIETAVYLVHSIGSGPDWVADERRDAENFARHAAESGVRRIVYLGGLGRDRDRLSPHLASRHAVGVALRSSGLAVIELRIGVVIGSGSASFEMLRYLVEVLPLMITPKWVATRCQPIAISDVITFLVHASTAPSIPADIYEVGGPDVVTYSQLMDRYAEIAGLAHRRRITLPVLSPGLSARWVGFVTPVPLSLARELVESLVNEVVVTNDKAASVFPVRPIPLGEAMERALAATARGDVPTSFLDSSLLYFAPASTDPNYSGGTTLTDVRVAEAEVAPARVYDVIASIGGAKGWYSSAPLWRVRGVLDQLVGGPGLRRGRRRATELRVGDPVDFWRVEAVIPDRLVRLHAEMRLPGDAWLSWRIEPTAAGGSRVTQTAEYRPRGLLGRLYWLAVAPFHRFVFPGLLHGVIADASTRPPASEAAPAGRR